MYLDRERAGIDWLLDPESPRLRALVAEAEARRPATPCDADVLARDVESLARLIADRHFGVATGLVEAPDAALAAWERRIAARPRTWGEAVAELQHDLRETLRGEHIRLLGAREKQADADGPTVDEEVVGACSCWHRTDWPLEAGDQPWDGRMLVLVDGRTRSFGESSAQGLGARLLGSPTTGMIEYGNIVPYVLPDCGLVISLPTKHNDYGRPVESVGFPVDVTLDDDVPAAAVASEFESFV